MSENSGCGLPNEFCFMNLITGAKVIGFLCFLSSLIGSILLLIYLAHDVSDITAEISDNNYEIKEKLDDHSGSAKLVAGLLLLMTVLYLIASILLIKGANNKSKKQMVPFLGITFIAIVISLLISIMQFQHGPFYAVLTIAVVLLYFFLCVYALYKNLSVDY